MDRYTRHAMLTPIIGLGTIAPASLIGVSAILPGTLRAEDKARLRK